MMTHHYIIQETQKSLRSVSEGKGYKVISSVEQQKEKI